MNKRLLVAIASVGLIAACSSPSTGTDKDALPQGNNPGQSVTAPESAPAKPSTCDAVREAILTGTKADLEKSLKALIKDKTADATAREAAQDYLNETDATLKGMHLDLIQMACAV